MPTCIYCKRPTSETEDRAHVFPEALAQNDLLLPAGAACGGCNRYLGHELDAALLHHPVIAFCIQFLGVPGKRGKPRMRIGRVTRDHGGAVFIDIEKPTRVAGSVNVMIGPDRHFNILRFRRGLHHIAFNLLALERGAHHALQSYLDPARQYVRRPLAGQAWPFVQIVENIDSIRPVVQGRLVPEALGETVCLRIFNCDFYVDLSNSGDLEEWARGRFDDPSSFVPETWKPDRRDKLGGSHRYRIQIGPD
jgi:hypothetical protein